MNAIESADRIMNRESTFEGKILINILKRKYQKLENLFPIKKNKLLLNLNQKPLLLLKKAQLLDPDAGEVLILAVEVGLETKENQVEAGVKARPRES